MSPVLWSSNLDHINVLSKYVMLTNKLLRSNFLHYQNFTSVYPQMTIDKINHLSKFRHVYYT